MLITISKNKVATLKELQPDSVITLFHGSDPTTIYKMCKYGIDGKTSVVRRTSHMYTNEKGERFYVKRGLFVTWDMSVAKNFGSAIIKFKTLAKNIISTSASLDYIHSKREGLKKRGKWQKSFRPEVSAAFIDGGEREGLFIGVVSEKAIEKVYIIKNGKYVAISPEEFIDMNKGDYPSVYELELTAHDYPKVSYQYLIDKAIKKYPGTTEEYIRDELLRVLHGAKTFEQQISSLYFLVGTYSVAKKLLLDMVRLGYVKKMPPKKED